MHPAIAQFPGDLFYGGRLLDGIRGGDRPEPPGFAWPRSNFPVAFVNVTDGWEGTPPPSSAPSSSSMVITSLDAPIVSAGEVSPFPTPSDNTTIGEKLQSGMHWNVHNNIWNTNFPQWYPFVAKDKDARFRFQVDLAT